MKSKLKESNFGCVGEVVGVSDESEEALPQAGKHKHNNMAIIEIYFFIKLVSFSLMMIFQMCQYI